MGLVYVMGGLGESVLARNQNGSREVWIDPGVILLGKVLEMRLAPNGIDPGPPDGVQLYATSAIGPYVLFPTAILAYQLVYEGYTAITHWWDWRKAIYPAGVDLANKIRANVIPADPCSIVAHSAGGLVARAAWTDLGTTGQQSLIRRIVTLGTPHWGSYTIVDFFGGRNQSIDLLTYWNQTVGYNTAGYAPGITGYQYVTVLQIRNLAMTWPAMYDLLPTLGAPGSEYDPNRATLYDANNWPAEARPSQTWLDWSRDHTGPWLRSTASQPPAHILTCVSGNANTVANALTDPTRISQSGTLGNYLPGDGAVSRLSSALASGVNWSYGIDHENWLPNLANNGDLAEFVREERAPGPPPLPVTSPDIQTTNVQPLPFPEGLSIGPPSMVCAGGSCPC